MVDEADALFGKRTEVTSSNDRHANQEVNFLLQRLESYLGICILTTNHETAIDEAVRRRLSVHVRFAMPDLEGGRGDRTSPPPARSPAGVRGDGQAEPHRADGITLTGSSLRRGASIGAG